MSSASLLDPPLFSALEGSNSILLAGAGGGFDVFCAIPLYYALKGRGKTVHLASLSFTFPDMVLPVLRLDPRWRDRLLSSSLIEVDADAPQFGSYFPERYLAEWARSRGEELVVHAVALCGARPLAEAYRILAERLGLDAIVLVDGGSDSLMRGDEEGIGTPSEDMASIVAADSLDLPVKLLSCIGFGADWYHGISHARALEATAELSSRGAFLGILSLLDDMPEARLYREACEHVFSRMPGQESIVSSSILSALAGRYGNWHALPRTRRADRVYVSPLMSAYWTYRLEAVAERLLYPLESLLATETIADVDRVITEWRMACPAFRPDARIPI